MIVIVGAGLTLVAVLVVREALHWLRIRRALALALRPPIADPTAPDRCRATVRRAAGRSR